jgi:hypothetical protein
MTFGWVCISNQMVSLSKVDRHCELSRCSPSSDHTSRLFGDFPMYMDHSWRHGDVKWRRAWSIYCMKPKVLAHINCTVSDCSWVRKGKIWSANTAKWMKREYVEHQGNESHINHSQIFRGELKSRRSCKLDPTAASILSRVFSKSIESTLSVVRWGIELPQCAEIYSNSSGLYSYGRVNESPKMKAHCHICYPPL